jgi:hypothetical protein
VRHGCLTWNRVLGNEIVTLYVGPKRKQFTVHKKLLCDRCEFFSKAFRGNFSEAEKGEMNLPDDDPGAFSSLVDYLYRGVLLKAKDDYHASLLLELYILAEKLCLSTLMDKACDAAHSYSSLSGKRVTPKLIAHIYSRTHGGSKLRKFCLVKWHIIWPQHVPVISGKISSMGWKTALTSLWMFSRGRLNMEKR